MASEGASYTSILNILLRLVATIFCFSFAPSAAAEEMDEVGDTPNPGKGLRSLHSWFHIACGDRES